MTFCLRETKESHFLASWMFWERLAVTARTCNPCLPYKRKWMKFVQSQNVISLSVFRYYTSSNQRLGSVFDELDPRLSLLCDVIRPCKIICGNASCASQDPYTHGNVVPYNLDSNPYFPCIFPYNQFLFKPLVFTFCAMLSLELSKMGLSTVGGCIAMYALTVGSASELRIVVSQKLLLWKHTG